MFKFIESENERTKITEKHIEDIEKKLNIKFPEVLREYYLKHNGAEIKECHFEMYKSEFIVYSICDLSYGEMPVEKIIENNKEDGWIPKECYPIAEDDINKYYWDTTDGKVYYYMIDDIENPTMICENVEKFFEILNSCCDEKNKINKLTKNDYKNKSNINNITIYIVCICIIIGLIYIIFS